MMDLALEDEISGTIRLYDIDRKAAQTNEVIGNHLMNRPEAKGDWKFEVKDSLKEVLTGCDFAVISILPGTLMRCFRCTSAGAPWYLSVSR